jgi:hypothetical protein
MRKEYGVNDVDWNSTLNIMIFTMDQMELWGTMKKPMRFYIRSTFQAISTFSVTLLSEKKQ